MTKLFKNNPVNFWLLLLLFFALVAGFFLIKNFTVNAQEKTKLFPEFYSGDWQNMPVVFIQDLSGDSGLDEFNGNNSAHPLVIEAALNNFKVFLDLDGEDSTSSEETIIDEPIVEEQPIEEPVIEENKAQEKVLILSNFFVPEELKEGKIEMVQLRLSLAGRGVVGDKLTIEYYNQDSWQEIDEIDLENEISNYSNGGYFLYGLPVFSNWEELEGLELRFTYKTETSDESSQLYLDAAWLEIEAMKEIAVIDTIKPLFFFKFWQQPAGLGILKSDDYYFSEDTDDVSGKYVNEFNIGWEAEYNWNGNIGSLLEEKEIAWQWIKEDDRLIGKTEFESVPIGLNYFKEEGLLKVKADFKNTTPYPVEDLVYRFIINYPPGFSFDSQSLILSKGEEKIGFNFGSDASERYFKNDPDNKVIVSMFVGTIGAGESSEVIVNLFSQ